MVVRWMVCRCYTAFVAHLSQLSYGWLPKLHVQLQLKSRAIGMLEKCVQRQFWQIVVLLRLFLWWISPPGSCCRWCVKQVHQP
eukprot:2246653-Amphidinium_carterae.1